MTLLGIELRMIVGTLLGVAGGACLMHAWHLYRWHRATRVRTDKIARMRHG